MSRIRSAVSVRSNATAATAKSGKTNRTMGTSRTAKTSSTVFEYPCNPCMRDKENVEATNYCEDCGENLCANCVRQHMKFPGMKNHKILGKSERRANDGSNEAPKQQPMECIGHPGKSVDMYCADHDQVWCGACIAVNHRTCHNVMLIQFAAKGVTKRDEYTEAKENIRKAKKDLTNLKKRAERDIARIDKQKATMMNKIKESRKRIDKVLDDMEKATIEELEKACSRGTTEMQEDARLYSEVISSLDALGGMLTAAKAGSEGEVAVFVGTVRAKEKIEEAVGIMNFVKHTLTPETIKFVPDGRIAGWLKSLRFLGTFSHQQKVFTGSFLERHDVSMSNEYKDCDMFGAELLKDGRLLLTDWDNKKVKLLDKSFSVIDQVILNGHPDDVCATNPQEAAVTITMDQCVQFVKLAPQMMLTRTINTEEHCRGIAYYDGQLYVVCGGFKNEGDGKIKVYSVTGELLRIIERNNSGQRIFSSPIAVSVVSDGKILHVTDGQKGIITLTSANDVISVVSNNDLSWPCGICVDKNDNVLICNSRSHTVTQMCGIGKTTIVLSKNDGVKKPHSICFDPNNLRLIMTSHKSKFISVFQLTAVTLKQIAEGTKVLLSAANKDKTTDNQVNENKVLNDRLGLTDQMTKLNLKSLKPGTEFTKADRTKGTNVVTVRSRQSKEGTSDMSDRESLSNAKTTGLFGSRVKSTSRESVATSVASGGGQGVPNATPRGISASRDTSTSRESITTGFLPGIGKGKSVGITGGLLGTKSKSVSKESVATTSASVGQASQLSHANPVGSARGSKMSGRLDRKEISSVNVGRKNSISSKN